MNKPGLPTSLKDNPSLKRWVHFQDDGTVRVATGRVEMGQGVVTAMWQIAAEELDVPLERVRVLSGNTDSGPNELYTASSQSIEVGGASLRLACAEVRARALDYLALRLNCARSDLDVRDGAFTLNNAPTGYDYWKVAPSIDWEAPATGTATPKPVSAHRLVGVSVPRIDLPAKVTGAPIFVHDMRPANMLHARVLRQPNRGANLVSLNEDAIRRAAQGEISFVRIHNFVGIVGNDEAAVQRAVLAAPNHAKWEGVRDLDPIQGEASWIRDQESDDRKFGAPEQQAEGQHVQATFSRGFLSHASLAPSCALAEFKNGHLTLWSHGQGMHPLRNNVAAALGIKPDDVSANHVHGAGCYGHNGADDCAMDAAIIAMQIPDRPIRVLWTRADEFGFEPLSSATMVTVHAHLDANGRPHDFTTEIWSGTHGQRPGVGGATLLPADALPKPPPPRQAFDVPEDRGGGATRNGVPLYDIAAKRMLHHLTLPMPVRTSSLRGLGAIINIFAIESFLEELAEMAGEDAVDYRLSMLTSEPRAAHILKRCAELAGWKNRGETGTGSGLGIAVARYKNISAYCAIAAQIEVEEHVRVRKIWCVTDPGLAINPDGVTNQLEGGIVQAVSWALKEQVQLGGDGVRSRDWDSYPVIRFSEVPEIVTELIDAREHPPLGVGECVIGPTIAAIGNAVYHALGTRVRDLPMTRDRIMAALN
jgi:CO/xanthine dehydrogenase Mo-binding subunit